MSAEVKKWMIGQIEPLLHALPKDIADIAKQLVDWIKADSDFGLFCKQSSNGALQLGVMEEKEENGKLAKSTAWKNKLSIDLEGAAVFPSAVVPSQGARVQIELDRIF